MFLWIGRQVNPAIISTLFGVPSLDGVDISKLAIQPEVSEGFCFLRVVLDSW